MELTRKLVDLEEDIRCLIDLESYLMQPFLGSEMEEYEEYIEMIEKRIVEGHNYGFDVTETTSFRKLLIIFFSSLLLNKYIIEKKGSYSLKENLELAHEALEEYEDKTDPEYRKIVEEVDKNVYFPMELSPF